MAWSRRSRAAGDQDNSILRFLCCGKGECFCPAHGPVGVEAQPYISKETDEKGGRHTQKHETEQDITDYAEHYRVQLTKHVPEHYAGGGSC